MAAFKYRLPAAVKLTADLRSVVELTDPAGVFTLEAGALVDIDDAERWGLTTVAAELARADAPRDSCPMCGSAIEN